MARRKRAVKVYYNSDTDTWTNDSHEEPYLMPGTEAYEAYQKTLAENSASQKDDEFHEKLEDRNEDLRKEQLAKEASLDHAYEVANRKFRRRMSKERQNKEIQNIVSDGLGSGIDISGGVLTKVGVHGVDTSNQDELYDDGIDADHYKKAVISEYKGELNEAMREVPNVDTNGDGEIDSDDVEVTPGMRRMARYM